MAINPVVRGDGVLTAEPFFDGLDDNFDELDARYSAIDPQSEGAVFDGVTDNTTILNGLTAGVDLDINGDCYINGVCTLTSSVTGAGKIIIGLSGALTVITETDQKVTWALDIENSSGDENKQLLAFISDDGATKKGIVTVRDTYFIGSKNAVIGTYLDHLYVYDNNFSSTNTIVDSFAEAHVTANNINKYHVHDNYSTGGTVAFTSGSGTIEDIYENNKVYNTYDHGIYSSSTTGKLRTVMNDNTVIDAGGNGIKCYSNGNLFITTNIIVDPGNSGIIPVGDAAFVVNNTVIGASDYGIHHEGKTTGAGLNTFSRLVVKNNHIESGNYGVRIYGPDSIDKVTLNNNDVTCDSGNAVIVDSGTSIDTLDIDGGQYNVDDGIILALRSGDDTSIKNLTLNTTTTTSNLIDCTLPSISLDNIKVRGTQATRILRNRDVTGVVTVGRVDWDLALTSPPYFDADSLLLNTAIKCVQDSGNYATFDFGGNAPTSGTYAKGSVIFNTSVAAGGAVGWVCVTAGTPGTWNTFGAVAA